MLNQNPSNVRGWLLNLSHWPPALILAKIEIKKAHSLIKIHGILRMTVQNTTHIGHGLGMWIRTLLEIDGSDTLVIIYKNLLCVQVEIDTIIPIVSAYKLVKMGKKTFDMQTIKI
jgi:hypothetical protein